MNEPNHSNEPGSTPVLFPTDVCADRIRRPVTVRVQVPAPPRRVVVAANFRVRCMWPDVAASEAKRCQHCRLRENGGADLTVDIALPPDEAVAAVGNERAFLEAQARQSVRCYRDCSQVRAIEGRDLFLHAGFEPLDPDRAKADGFMVEVISETALPVGEPLHVTGRVVEVGAKGLRLVHDGPVEPAPEPPDEASRLRARTEMRAFPDLDALTRAVQRDLTHITRTSVTDMTAALLLTLLSPSGLPLHGGRQNLSRRCQTLLLGDYGVFKSSTTTALMDIIGFGTVVGPRTTVAGLVGTIEEVKGIPRPRWGAMVREDHGLLNIEEGGTLNPQVIAAIRDARERGWISLHMRGVSSSARSAPAIIVNANPSTNRTLASFGIWAEALTALSNHELPDLRRFTIVVPISLDALSAPPIDTNNLPMISAHTLRTMAWVARTIGANRIDLHSAAVALAIEAERELQRSLPRHACLQALLNHAANKILYLATAWAIACQIPLEGERVHVGEPEVAAVLALYKRTILAWTTRGSAEVFDPEKIKALLKVLRDASCSRGRKHRLDPLNGLRVLRSAPFGLTMREWSAQVGASDKTIRDAWLTLLFEPHALVERVSTRYRVTPLGRAVLATAETDPPQPGGSGDGQGPHGEGVEIAEITEVAEPETDSQWADIRIPEIPEQATRRDPVRQASESERSGEIPEIAEVPGAPRMRNGV